MQHKKLLRLASVSSAAMLAFAGVTAAVANEHDTTLENAPKPAGDVDLAPDDEHDIEEDEPEARNHGQTVNATANGR